MFDHVGIKVSNLKAALRFYDAALRPLGHEQCYLDDASAGYGAGGKPCFWLHVAPAPRVGAQVGAHLAFAAPDRRSVEAFHAAGLKGGGSDNGGPGLRSHYSPQYFAAFLIDPDGNNIEAVCMTETG
jgi:catechol 2,3-dioxygenase-like lactoylglutathione lyase family enzyme